MIYETVKSSKEADDTISVSSVLKIIGASSSGYYDHFTIEQVSKGGIFVVRPGENIPVDGVVLDGNSAVDESTLTGESIPVDKAAGSVVSAGTLNQSGYIRCQATRVAEDTALSQIIQMVSDVAAAMSLSSFSVVTNALRLNFFEMHDSKRDHKIKNKLKITNEKETKIMEKTLKIEGMMCGHCEMHTKKALEALDGVTKAEVSHKTGTAVVTLEKNISDDILKQAVVDQGYQVTDIQ